MVQSEAPGHAEATAVDVDAVQVEIESLLKEKAALQERARRAREAMQKAVATEKAVTANHQVARCGWY